MTDLERNQKIKAIIEDMGQHCQRSIFKGFVSAVAVADWAEQLNEMLPEGERVTLTAPEPVAQ